jgi:CRISPR system Cascade subunit CasE
MDRTNVMRESHQNSDSSLNILRIALRPSPLYEFAYRTGILRSKWGIQDRSDIGYIVHGAFAACFGPFAPKPFYVLSSYETRRLAATGYDGSKHVIVLGYTEGTWDQLYNHWTTIPEKQQNIIDWEYTQIKRIPTTFLKGKRLTFTVRACPVIRTKLFRTSDTDPSAEIDAFVAAYHHYNQSNVEQDPPNRFDIYREWIASKLQQHGTIVESLQISGFMLCDITRRNRNRALHTRQRPAVECHGVLSVVDPIQFSTAIRQGIGRHRAFGFGMLRLAPA